MNTNVGLIGKKLGNTQIFQEDGAVTRVTAIEVGPCTVLGKRTEATDGYTALIMGFGDKREKLVTKPEAGFFAKSGQKVARTIKEFRLPAEKLEAFEIGQVLKPSECFEVGQKVDVCATSKGKGFAGVMKRWNFAGSGKDTHGTHEVKRHGGSIGANMTPGRVWPGLKMAGQYGNTRMTMLNLKVAAVLDEENIVMVKGSVPGARNGILTVRGAVKTRKPKAS